MHNEIWIKSQEIQQDPVGPSESDLGSVLPSTPRFPRARGVVLLVHVACPAVRLVVAPDPGRCHLCRRGLALGHAAVPKRRDEHMLQRSPSVGRIPLLPRGVQGGRDACMTGLLG